MRWRLAVVLVLAWVAGSQQLSLPSARQALGMSYEEETPPIAVRLELRALRGQVRDRMGNKIAGVALGLFTDAGPHQLLQAATSDGGGQFDFGRTLASGRYRLIAKYPGLCTANIPVEIAPGARHSRLELRMEFPGLDVCSYALAK